VILKTKLIAPKRPLTINEPYGNIRFEVHTAMTIKNAAFWDVIPLVSCQEPQGRTAQKTAFFIWQYTEEKRKPHNHGLGAPNPPKITL
jgi:hypothetical protein